MELSEFTFILTDDCNYNCIYCPQKKEKNSLKQSSIKKAVDFFYPFFKEGREDQINIGFYGGEPLLEFMAVKYILHLLKEKQAKEPKEIKYLLTTNGSLLTDEILDFFIKHKFSIMLSFDGLAQEVAREPGSLEHTASLVKKLRQIPEIEFSINSVFSIHTIDRFADSMKFIIDTAEKDINFDIALNESWGEERLAVLDEQLTQFTDYLVDYYKRTGVMPINSYPLKKGRKRKGFVCSGGRRRLSLTPQEDVWGCYVFHDFFKGKEDLVDYDTYYFGKLDEFVRDYETVYPRVLENYNDLRQDCFYVGDQKDFCFLCDDVKRCVVCPVYAAHTTGMVGCISPWVCSVKRLEWKEKERFLDAIDAPDVEEE